MNFKLFDKVSYDPEADAMYILVNDKKIKDTQEHGSGIFIDYSSEGSIVGIEIINPKKNKSFVDKVLYSHNSIELCV